MQGSHSFLAGFGGGGGGGSPQGSSSSSLSSTGNLAPIGFDFVVPQESDFPNAWKESFKQLYKCIHVRAGYQEEYEKNPARYQGRRMTYFETVEQAFNYCEEVDNPIVLIHSGVYKGEFLIIDSKVTFLGAAPNS